MSSTQKKYNKLIIVVTGLTIFLTGFVGGYLSKRRGIPFVREKELEWSIGIYMGTSPFEFFPPQNVKNPVLTADHISDVPASFVADPFVIIDDNVWYMFFEVMNKNTKQGDIGVARSNDGINWTYEQIVLDEQFHLSYPYVFKFIGEYYMIPETSQTNSIRLYKATDFPKKWSFVTTLLKSHPYVDPSVIYFENQWYMFASTKTNDVLYLYYADELEGPWIEHPHSPIIKGDANIARPAGRVLLYHNNIVRYTQDDDPIYGNQVRAFEVTILTPQTYEEREVSQNPILRPSGKGWNGKRMHHIDAHQLEQNEWIACVDGWGQALVFGLAY